MKGTTQVTTGRSLRGGGRAWGSFLALAILSAISAADAPAAPILLSGSAVFTEEVPEPPKDTLPDTFSITNGSGGGVQITSAVISLANSLVFDTVVGGGGEDPAHPFISTVAGGLGISVAATVSDGGTSITLQFTGFDAGEVFTFSIDVDDPTDNNQNQDRHVVGEEFVGSTLQLTFSGPLVGSPQSLGGSFIAEQGHVWHAQVRGEAEASGGTETVVNPEPSAIFVWGAISVVGGFTWFKRRRRSAA